MEPGTYITWDMYGKIWHAWHFLRRCRDEDFKEYHSAVELHLSNPEYRPGYWLMVDLATARVSIWHENLMTGWTHV